jgi:hypothetical protein
MRKIEELHELLLNHALATKREITLVTKINGYSEGTLLDILQAVSGYQSVEEYLEDEG